MGEDEEEVMAGHVTVMDESSASTRRIPSFMVFCVVGYVVKQCFVEKEGWCIVHVMEQFVRWKVWS